MKKLLLLPHRIEYFQSFRFVPLEIRALFVSPSAHLLDDLGLTQTSELEAKEYILGIGNQMKIIEPERLQGEILKMAETAVVFYKKQKIR